MSKAETNYKDLKPSTGLPTATQDPEARTAKTTTVLTSGLCEGAADCDNKVIDDKQGRKMSNRNGGAGL
jgi:hypothetical protein